MSEAFDRPLRRRERRYGLIFVAPYVVLLLGFGVVPSGYALLTSITDSNRGGLHFTWLTNYRTVVHDFRFIPAVEHVASYMAIWLPSSLLAIVTLALLLHARIGRFSAAMRLVYYIPSAITGSASVLMWLFMLDPIVSPARSILHALGFQTITDVLQPGNLPWVFALMGFAAAVGFWVVVLYAALVGIPQDVLDAARIDGCNGLHLARFVKLPLIRKYLAFMVILSIADGSQLFTEPTTAAQAVGGSLTTTWSINQLGYDYAFRVGDFGAAAALSMLLLGVALVAAVAILLTSDFLEAAP